MKLTSSVMPDLAIRRGTDSAHLVIEIALASHGVGTTTRIGTMTWAPRAGGLTLVRFLFCSRMDRNFEVGRIVESWPR